MARLTCTLPPLRFVPLRALRVPLLLLAVLVLAGPARAQSPSDVDTSRSEMRRQIERYATDRSSLQRRYRVPMSPLRRERMRRFHAAWRAALDKLPFEKMSLEGRIDWLLLANRLDYELRRIDREAKRDAEIAALLPFAGTIVELAEARRRMEPVNPRQAAEKIDALKEQAAALGRKPPAASPVLARRAATRLDALRRELRAWFRYHDGYDPLFRWWVRKPWEEADQALEAYGKALRKTVPGDGTLVGDPIGREALLEELAHEAIPYTPEELIGIAERELAWCDAEMEKAARELGFDDWRTAQEQVKSLHVEPGKQPQLIADLARDAVAFLDRRDLVTVPGLCRETWRMEMMSPERQKTSPYFLGGETILVSYPTEGMSHKDKLMSMRGNNLHFARATVQHELIPGHHLQGFMTARWRTHRRVFRTPFWVEGWALYWEMRLYELGFPRSPEDRIGMLFWRKHRCARILFSLRFHLGQMTAPEAVDFLVQRIGHEKNNAAAEVRRSVGGAYGPLYQAAYMLGGLQIRALQKELVPRGKWTERRFHDAVLRQNAIPIELIRAALTGQELTRDFSSRWRFYGEVGDKGR